MRVRIFENFKKFELTKKIVPPKINKSPYIESLNLANYSDKQSASDYFVDEKSLNLTLVPVSETMLFSGIPEPEVKPIPEKPNHYKATTISVKNKKSLKKNLAKFLEKNEEKFVYDRIKNYVDFNVKENIKFLFDGNDKIIEINTFAKNLEQMNLRRNFNDDFIFYIVNAPTDTKVVKKKT